mmetsp:Transcript_16450/g.31255  ORF Transcript_16450/g.31255 Transcript_16450/m.31255 type:complete len:93 (+) Transcript_16450:211-489(+)
MAGLIEPKKFEKLFYAMKREKGEKIQTDLRAMAHLDIMMKYGMSPFQPQINGVQSAPPSGNKTSRENGVQSAPPSGNKTSREIPYASALPTP